MTPVEALKMALSKENASIKLYEKLAADNPPIRELLLSLMNEEHKHKILIEKKIYEYTQY